VTIRWGLIGAGDIVRKRVAAALRETPMSELMAISRARVELAASFASSVGARQWYARWEDLVADPAVDAVYVATPVHLHASQTIAAAEAGKHVLCEKPMAMDVHECDRMIAACDANGVQLGIAYYRHFYPVIGRIKKAIASGEIGQPVLAQMNAFEHFNPAADDPKHWLLDKSRSGGGPMFDFGCHRLEVLQNIFGSVRRVTSMIANVVFDREVEDTAAVLLQFARGICATLAVTHAAVEPQDTLDVFGTAGSIHVARLNTGSMCIRTNGDERTESHPPAANLHAPLIQDFVEAVSKGRSPAVGGEIGRMVARLEDAIYAGSKNGVDAG
jgi:predicted dehydrogenase